VTKLRAKADRLGALGQSPRSVTVNVPIGAGRAVVGTVPGIRGDCLTNVTFSRLKGNLRLAAWAQLLALVAHDPGGVGRAVTVGRAPKGDIACSSVLTAPEAGSGDGALELLRRLVDLFDRGMRAPLPLYTDTSWAWARAIHAGEDARKESKSFWPAELADTSNALVLGEGADLDRLLREEVPDHEAGDGWPGSSRFERYALRLWTPILEHQE